MEARPEFRGLGCSRSFRKQAAFDAWLTVSRGLWHFGDMADRSACIPGKRRHRVAPVASSGGPSASLQILVIPALAPTLPAHAFCHSEAARTRVAWERILLRFGSARPVSDSNIRARYSVDARGREAQTRRRSGSNARQSRPHAGAGAIAGRGASFVLTDEPPKKGGSEVCTDMCRGTNCEPHAVRNRCRRAARLCVVTGDVPRGRSARLKRESLGMRRCRRDARSFHSAPHCCVAHTTEYRSAAYYLRPSRQPRAAATAAATRPRPARIDIGKYACAPSEVLGTSMR